MTYLVVKVNSVFSDLFAVEERIANGLKKFTARVSVLSRSWTLLLLFSAFILGIVYVAEFHSVIKYGENLVILNTELKKAESGLATNEVAFSQLSSLIISEDFTNKASGFEKVSNIEYIEKKSFVEMPRYIP